MQNPNPLHHRQNPNPNHPKNTTAAGQFTTVTIGRNHHDLHPAADHRSQVIYFENFPRSWKSFDLENSFSKYKVIGRVSLAQKVSRRGCSFGFLRPIVGADIDWVLIQLNMIIIGQFKLRAYRSRFSNGIQQAVVWKQPVIQKPKPIVNQSFRDDRSYANVTSPRKNPASPDYEVFNDIKLKLSLNQDTITEKNKDWLERSIVARVNSVQSVLQTKSYLLSKDVVFDNVSIMGGCWTLITFDSIMEAILFLEGKSKNMGDFYHSFSKAIDFNIPTLRMTWISISGVPLALWCPEIFEEIASTFGETIKVHPLVYVKERIDTGAVMISTTSGLINKTVTVMLGEQSFRIHVFEVDQPVYFNKLDDEEEFYEHEVDRHDQFEKETNDYNIEERQGESVRGHYSNIEDLIQLDSEVARMNMAGSKSVEQNQNLTVNSPSSNSSVIPETVPNLFQVELSASSSSDCNNLTAVNITSRKKRPVKVISPSGSLKSCLELQNSSDKLSDGDFANMNRLIISAKELAAAVNFEEALRIWDVGHSLGLLHRDSKATTVNQLLLNLQQDLQNQKS